MLHYRAWPGMGETLDGLLAQTRRPDEVVVVDHASGDGSVVHIRDAYPAIELVELEENRGPTAGMNRLISEIMQRGVDAVFVFPHDIELAPDALEHLAIHLEDNPRLGAVGPLVGHQRDRERVFCAGGHVDPRTWDFTFVDQPSRMGSWRGRPPHPVDFLELGGILLRADAVRAAGGLPVRFYYMHDDLDYTLRIGSLGWGLECVPAARAWQDLGDPGRTDLIPPPPPYLQVRNRLGLIANNAPRRILAREILRVLSWLVRDAVRPRGGSRSDLWPRFRGLADFCLGRWGPPPPSAR